MCRKRRDFAHGATRQWQLKTIGSSEYGVFPSSHGEYVDRLDTKLLSTSVWVVTPVPPGKALTEFHDIKNDRIDYALLQSSEGLMRARVEPSTEKDGGTLNVSMIISSLREQRPRTDWVWSLSSEHRLAGQSASVHGFMASALKKIDPPAEWTVTVNKRYETHLMFSRTCDGSLDASNFFARSNDWTVDFIGQWGARIESGNRKRVSRSAAAAAVTRSLMDLYDENFMNIKEHSVVLNTAFPERKC